MNLDLRFKSNFLKTFFVSLILISYLVYLISAPQVSAQEEDATSSVREKVRQAIENLTKKPRAAIGNLDNISDKTLQIKNLQGKITLVATNDKTVYAKYTKGKKSDIKFEDLSLGDFTVAMGYKNGNDTIEATRVLTFDSPPFANKKVVYASVDTVAKTSMTITGIKSNDEWTLDTTSKPVITIKQNGKLVNAQLSDIEEGDTIIAIGIENEKKSGTLIPARIHIVRGTASTTSSSPQPSSSAKPKASASPSATSSPKASAPPKASPKPIPSPAE